ncbi:MAG: hypothetical protein M3O30_11880 [Planctomycetota bacterium]|nr:hypothetical protein [Planctomycetota bacterium]
MRFIIPNFHVILIHFPLAFLGFGLLIEIFSFLWRRSSFRLAGRWMILLGTLLLLPATTSGIYAFFDIVGHGQTETDSWADLKASSGFSATDWQLARNHILFNSLGAALALIAVVGWIGSSDRWRRKLYLPGMAALVISMGLITAGAWHGGEMVYRQGFGVEGRQGVLQPQATPPTELQDKIEFYAPRMQLHIIMAGLVFAMSAAALGLSLRRSWLVDDLVVRQMPTEHAAAELASVSKVGSSDPQTVSATPLAHDPSNSTVISTIAPQMPCARFWVLAAGLALLTILGGFYAGDFVKMPQVLDWDRVNRTLGMIKSPGERRMALHIIFGVSILLLILILAILAQWTPRKHVPLGVISGLLILIMAGQVWMGILLLYDGPGPILRFKAPGETIEKPAAPPPPPAPAVSTPTVPAVTMPSMPALPTTLPSAPELPVTLPSMPTLPAAPSAPATPAPPALPATPEPAAPAPATMPTISVPATLPAATQP